MTDSPPIIVTPWESSSGTCDCCGRTSKQVWGSLSVCGETTAIYYVQWTVGSADHFPNIDLILGPWGEGSNPDDRILVSLLFRPSTEGGAFMVIDAQGRAERYSTLLGHSMPRAEVIGTPLAPTVFEAIDAVWTDDPRIAEVKELNHFA